ncbi:MAG: hypothetical protein R3B09_30460 [Nannocystaceae bacterium]
MPSPGSVRGRGDDPRGVVPGRAYEEMTTPPATDEIEDTHRDLVPSKINAT